MVGLKIISLGRRKIDLNEIVIDHPSLYLAVDQNGRTNLPATPSAAPGSRPTNVFDLAIGHFVINREGPQRLEKIKDKIIHIHLSETQGYDHTNSIIGTGTVDFPAYVHKAVELGIEKNCKRVGEPCIAGIEMGEPHFPVDNPDRWMQESLDYLAKTLPELTQ